MTTEDLRFKKWLRILGENDTEMSKIAADKLSEMGNLAAVPALIVAMEKRVLDVSLAATRALGKLKAREAIPALIRMMNEHPDITVNTAAAEALGLIGDASATQALKGVIDDYLRSNSDRYNRIHSFRRGLFTTAIWSLKQIGTPEARRIATNAESI